ncbi:MAG: hypothetical protein ABJC07_01205 [Acidobacteriota bacterium]
MRRSAIFAAAAVACTLWRCASSPSAPAAKAAPARPRAPYDAPAATSHEIDITIRSRAAREILASLSRPKFEATDMKLLEDLPAVRFTIQDSNRGVDVFERDFAAAFDEKARTAVFDFRSIRESRDRWQALLDAVTPREADLARMASTRAAALLPGDRAVTARLDVFLSFGVAALGDHIVLRGDNGREAMVLDLARAFGDSEGEPLESRLARIARLIAGEAFRQAWAAYRSQSPAWQHPDAQLGQLDVLLRAVAEAGPVALYTVDENFFPLSTWLKEPMKRALEDLNRRADRLAEAEGNLERRMELTGEIRRGDFARRGAGQDGAYVVDSVLQHAGLAGLRQALQAGPRALFDAYERATQADKSLVPLSKSIRDRLAGVPTKPAPAR